VTGKMVDGRGSTGEYRALYKYLHARFADRVVLTFSEIESVVGFALPAAAFVDLGWWLAGTTGDRTPQAEAWMSAERTAKVNLAARNVLFERA
jgi:hypothetical protein